MEKKFLLKGDDEKRLIEGADFIGKKVFTYIYYDTKDFSLTRNDNWLRQRAGKFELKLSLDKKAGGKANFYDEIEDENRIKEFLGISGGNMEDVLLKKGYSKFCICKTTRKKYKNGIFEIDIDFVEYGDFNYQLAEIEIMIENKTDMAGALENIIDFAKEKGLNTGYVRGKVLVYLKEKSPQHFKALVKAGVARE